MADAAQIPIPWNSGNATEGWQVQVFPPGSFAAFCWTPISGAYGLLPRILFYFTIFFALVGWGHKWLIAGALGASLVYSGQAAIHACLLVWSGSVYGENDLWALGAILSTSAIMAVPLLNWSKSIRDLSLDKNVVDDSRNFSKARTIIIYWGFLVITGLLSIMVIISVSDPTKLGYATAITSTGNAMVSCTAISTSDANSTFPPLKLGVYSKLDNPLQQPLIDLDWAQAHHCSNPCGAMAAARGPATFRQTDDYQLLSVRSIIKLLEVPEFVTSKDELTNNFQYFIRKWSVFILPYVILQGVWATAFGRRSPTQTRDALYIWLRDGGKPSINLQPAMKSLHPRRKLFFKMLALCTYFWALLVTIISMPVLFLTIFAIETYIDILPETASLQSIDSWAPWAGTALVLLAALISQFHNRAIATLRSGTINTVFSRSRQSFGRGVRHLGLPIWRWLRDTPSFEWKSFRQFWKDADNAIWFDRHGRIGGPTLSSNQAQAINLNSVVPRASWLVHQNVHAGSGTQPLASPAEHSGQNGSTSTPPSTFQNSAANGGSSTHTNSTAPAAVSSTLATRRTA